jgi:hypothetical protein
VFFVSWSRGWIDKEFLTFIFKKENIFKSTFFEFWQILKEIKGKFRFNLKQLRF